MQYCQTVIVGFLVIESELFPAPRAEGRIMIPDSILDAAEGADQGVRGLRIARLAHRGHLRPCLSIRATSITRIASTSTMIAIMSTRVFLYAPRFNSNTFKLGASLVRTLS